MSTITAEVFVGSDNATGRVDRDTLYAALDARYPDTGWTVTDAVGSWHGQREESVRVVLTDESVAALTGFLSELRDTLHQEAIAYRVISDLFTV
ncbi:MAG TPA: hypothetical protein VF062_22330 [Candidatus Limnocylindrales bacterium]